MRLIIVAISICLLGITSCRFLGGQRISGSGHIVTIDKTPGSFNSVRADGSMDIHVQQGATNSVKIQADDNLVPYIDVYIEGNTLVVRTRDGFNLNASRDIIVYATAPVFKDIDVSGSGDIIGDNTITGNDPLKMHVSGSGNITMAVNLSEVNTDISGSGDVELKGQVKDFSAEISGSGKVKCFDLQTDNTRLDLSGAADADVTANKKLDIEVSGSGSVRYKGAASVNQKVSGSGDVKKVD